MLKFKRRYLMSGKYDKMYNLKQDGFKANSNIIDKLFLDKGYNHIELQDRSSYHLEIILKKMFDIVGVDYNTFNFNDDRWYTKYSWNAKQEKEFENWMVSYLYNSSSARREILSSNIRSRSYIRRAIAGGLGFLFNYGWTRNDI